jgi:hypothetical protein
MKTTIIFNLKGNKMGTADLFRDLEWQIETRLVQKTFEHLRENWTWDISPEENLTRAVTSVVPFIFENHYKSTAAKAEWMNNAPEGNLPDEEFFDDTFIEMSDAEPLIRAKGALQELKEQFNQKHFNKINETTKIES